MLRKHAKDRFDWKRLFDFYDSNFDKNTGLPKADFGFLKEKTYEKGYKEQPIFGAKTINQNNDDNNRR